jgi:hypothetical protein
MTDETEVANDSDERGDRSNSEPPAPADETLHSTTAAMERLGASLPDDPTCGCTVQVVSIVGRSKRPPLPVAARSFPAGSSASR